MSKQAVIAIYGGVQVGKSIIADRIKTLLEREFGATVITAPGEHEPQGELAEWEREMVASTEWHLQEHTLPSVKDGEMPAPTKVAMENSG